MEENAWMEEIKELRAKIRQLQDENCILRTELRMRKPMTMHITGNLVKEIPFSEVSVEELVSSPYDVIVDGDRQVIQLMERKRCEYGSE